MHIRFSSVSCLCSQEKISGKEKAVVRQNVIVLCEKVQGLLGIKTYEVFINVKCSSQCNLCLQDCFVPFALATQ